MRSEEIQEPIFVGAVFTNSKIKPRWFIWKGRKYLVQEITFTWKDRQGEAPLVYFSLSDGTNIFEICFNQKTLNWHLVRLHLEG